MAWRLLGDTPFSEPNADPIHWRINAALRGDELITIVFVWARAATSQYSNNVFDC